MIDVAVVGAGVGGLAAAALLARSGARVAVFEQHFLAGGFCTSWERVVAAPDGRRSRFVFDAGVHDVSGVGEGGGVRQLLELLGAEGRVRWRRTS
ncbi:MAG TPA: FAD-dependent oxidoreductase, partial [Gemmatimonadales bacterium]|nr:FAD-dependent oxidoreductase [Gemmatimonadales bacterium]